MSGQRPRVVVFDLGKVLVDFDYSIAVRRFADRSEAGLERVQELVNSPIQFDYESGLITTDEFFAAVRDGAGFRGNRAEFVEIFADIFSPMERMIPFFDRVKVAGRHPHLRFLEHQRDCDRAHPRSISVLQPVRRLRVVVRGKVRVVV